MVFDKKKLSEEDVRKQLRKKQVEKIAKLSDINFSNKPYAYQKSIPKSATYLDFLREIKEEPETLYERACEISSKILKLKLSQATKDKIENNLRSAYIVATPEGAMTFTILSAVILSILVAMAFALGFGGTGTLTFLIFAFVIVWYIYNYPSSRSKIVFLRMSSDSVLAILYMVIYMRSSPNLEGALKFASENLKGPLSWDLKKLLWDVEIGKYPSADDAFLGYVVRWKDENKYFAESLHLLRNVSASSKRREDMFNEAVRVVLAGTKERAKAYSEELRMPMMMINALGVMLPIMGLVLFPIVLIFMSDVVKPAFIFFGYDLILPLMLWLLTDYTLQKRPPTFSQPDIKNVKGALPLGYIKIFGRDIPILPIVAIIALPLIFLGFLGTASADVFAAVNSSVFVISAMAFGIALYAMLDSWQKKKLRDDIEKIEDELSVALFQLGNKISSGAPLEISMDDAIKNMKDMKIAELFKTASSNMRNLGYTFEQSLFDEEVGAVRYYPSQLIESVMRTLAEASKKGVIFTSQTMITISNYLKDIHDVKEEMKSILGETLSSMKFLGMFLAPMVAGVTVTMAVVIIQILSSIGATLPQLVGNSGGMTAMQTAMVLPWAISGAPPITPAGFQLIVGIYMIEIAVLLSYFITKIEYGEDQIGFRLLAGYTLIIATVIYSMSWLMTFNMFGPTISALLTPVV